jgi:hypothetical protein
MITLNGDHIKRLSLYINNNIYLKKPQMVVYVKPVLNDHPWDLKKVAV